MQVKTGSTPKFALLPVFVGAALGMIGNAGAFEIENGNPDIQMRWDNTVRYNLAVRGQNPSNIGNNFQFDDSDYKFAKRGDTVTNRLDLLSEFDFVYQKRHGFRVSGAAWYDFAYRNLSVERNPLLTGGTTTVAYAGSTYSDYTKRYYKGPSGEILDAFVFTGIDIGEMPLSVKAGRHTVVWGESLFTTIHGIAFGQSPVDLAKAFATPGVEAKEVYRPLTQLSAQLGVTENLSVAAQYYFDWSATRLPEGGTYLGIIDMGFMGPTNFNAAGFGANSGNNEPDKRGDWGVSARWSPAWLDGTLGFYYRNFTDKTPTLFRFVPAAGTPYYKTFFGEDIDLYGISLSKQIAGVSVGAEVSYRRNMPLYSPLLQNMAGTAAFNSAVFPHGVPTLNGNTYQARGNTVHAVLNGVAVLPAASLGDFTLFDTAVVLGELTYSYLDKITDNQDMFQGVGHGICDASRRATLGANYRDKWDGCSTKEALGMTLSFTPSWLQVFPGVDLLAPMSFSKGLYGNSPVALGGNEDNGSYSIGLAADVYAQYRFDLKWVDYFGAAKYGAQAQTGSRVTTVNGLSTLLRDRGFLAFTFKTTF
ncbi:MAG: DUF1302 domain-containing protein [Rhodocyclaceae bacterium]|nr:DUF1302 domain-containing protein [Rhodocyclaceae bacterium]